MNINIVQKACCGCSACYSACPKKCISMTQRHDGFVYPKIDQNQCIDCGLCIKVCPVEQKQKSRASEDMPLFIAARANDTNLVARSSSGGIFSVIASKTLSSGGVVTGAAFDDEFQVRHICVEHEEDLKLLQGSKYSQSVMGDTYKTVKECLQSGRCVLFSGTPCQVAGLKLFLGKEYINLITVDFICHGVPTPKLWQKYINEMSKKFRGKVTQASFRSKKTGYSQYSLQLLFDNRREYCRVVGRDSYMRMFLQDCFLRDSCFECRFKTLDKDSDITLSDFWEVGNFLPEYDDDRGISLLYINTEKGKRLFEEIQTKINSTQISENQALYKNSAILHCPSKPAKRDYLVNNIDKYTIKELVKQACVPLWRQELRRLKYRLRK